MDNNVFYIKPKRMHCFNCGKILYGNHFCNAICKDTYYKGKKYNKIRFKHRKCKYCKKPLSTKIDSMFCSTICANAYYKEKGNIL